MAFIKCPECGREISDKAKSCSYCGGIIQELELLNRKQKRSVMIKKISIVAIILLFSFISIYILESYVLNSYFRL